MTYSLDGDVSRKITHISIATGLLISEFREEAYTNINIKLRTKYVVPVDSDDETDMDFLKSIESDLAAGSLILDIAANTQEDSGLDDYGKYLIDKGYAKLDKILKDSVILIGGEDNELNEDNYKNPARLGVNSPDNYGTYNRPMSGIENDAIEASVDAEKYNSLEDNEQL